MTKEIKFTSSSIQRSVGLFVRCSNNAALYKCLVGRQAKFVTTIGWPLARLFALCDPVTFSSDLLTPKSCHLYSMSRGQPYTTLWDHSFLSYRAHKQTDRKTPLNALSPVSTTRVDGPS